MTETMSRVTTRFLSRKERTPLYEAAVAALQALSEEGGSPTRAFAEAVAETRQQRFGARHKVKPSGGSATIARLIGKGLSQEDRYLLRPPGADHDSLWLRDGKPVMFVTQPYELHRDGMREIVAFCDQWNLDVTVDTADSWHFPGWTTLLRYERQGGV